MTTPRLIVNVQNRKLARQLETGEISKEEFVSRARALRIKRYRATIANPGPELPPDVVAHIRDVLLPAELKREAQS